MFWICTCWRVWPPLFNVPATLRWVSGRALLNRGHATVRHTRAEGDWGKISKGIEENDSPKWIEKNSPKTGDGSKCIQKSQKELRKMFHQNKLRKQIWWEAPGREQKRIDTQGMLNKTHRCQTPWNTSNKLSSENNHKIRIDNPYFQVIFGQK